MAASDSSEGRVGHRPREALRLVADALDRGAVDGPGMLGLEPPGVAQRGHPQGEVGWRAAHGVALGQ